MADRSWRGGNGGGGDARRNIKESTPRRTSTPRSSERPNGRSGVSPLAGGAALRTFQDAFTIGRSRRCDLVIPTSDDTRTISKVHARIFPLRHGADEVARSSPVVPGDRAPQQKWILQDLNTLNGTSINGMDLMPGGSMELHDGDELVLSSNLRTGLRLFVQIPDIDQSRLVARLYGPGSGYRPPQHTSPAGLADAPIWRGAGHALSRLGLTPPPPSSSHAATAVSPRVASVHTPPPPPAARTTSASSSLIKRQRSTDERSATRQSDNGQDAASAAHDSKRSRRASGDGDDKERLMLCSVCLDYFYNSATLACSHTFCGHCVSHWFRASAALTCPECRAGVRHMPVRNRALDALVGSLVGDSDAFRAAVRKCTTEERMGAAMASSTTGFDLRTHPLVFSRWLADERDAFHTYLAKQFGDARVAACRQIGLSEAAIDGASAAELHLAAQNLLIDCADLRASHEASERLKIYLHYG